jgi:hypothetical protein
MGSGIAIEERRRRIGNESGIAGHLAANPGIEPAEAHAQ